MQNCEVCSKKNLWQSSQYWTDERRWWQCRNCGNWQMELPPQGLRIPPKVLYVDIETAMMKVYAYDLYVPTKRISKDMIAQNSFVICWSAAWLNADNTIRRQLSSVTTPAEARKQNDRRIVGELHELLDVADLVIGHNSMAFDLKVLNWRFLLYGMEFPVYKQIDTYKLAGKYMRPPSKGLEFMSVASGGKPKQGLDRSEWIEIVEKGNPKLISKANRYCRGDVREGVKLFSRIASSVGQLYK